VQRSPERRSRPRVARARQLRGVAVFASIIAVKDRGTPMSDKVDVAKLKAIESKPYVKPTLVRGPVLASVTAVAKNISGVQPVCWVARAAFGETDIRWMIFREWLAHDAPAWFRKLYIRHGEAVGTWLVQKHAVRSIVRALMMPAIRRKIGR
jgi:hypothetical protein